MGVDSFLIESFLPYPSGRGPKKLMTGGGRGGGVVIFPHVTTESVKNKQKLQHFGHFALGHPGDER